MTRKRVSSYCKARHQDLVYTFKRINIIICTSLESLILGFFLDSSDSAFLLNTGSAGVPAIIHLLLTLFASLRRSCTLPPTPRHSSTTSRAIIQISSFRFIFLIPSKQSLWKSFLPWPELPILCSLSQKNWKQLFSISLTSPTPTCGLTKLIFQNEAPKKTDICT